MQHVCSKPHSQSDGVSTSIRSSHTKVLPLYILLHCLAYKGYVAICSCWGSSLKRCPPGKRKPGSAPQALGDAVERGSWEASVREGEPVFLRTQEARKL